MRNRGDQKTLGQLRRQVLEAVHRQVRLAIQERPFDRLGEQPFAAGIRQRALDELIALGFEPEILDIQRGVAALEPRTDSFCLHTRQLTGTGRDHDRPTTSTQLNPSRPAITIPLQSKAVSGITA